jgi:hypothetical protein
MVYVNEGVAYEKIIDYTNVTELRYVDHLRTKLDVNWKIKSKNT